MILTLSIPTTWRRTWFYANFSDDTAPLYGLLLSHLNCWSRTFSWTWCSLHSVAR